ncbi:MAG: hypothetical protein QNJ63_27350 [Calothrix sp. MO_192.B10]|nr:hypothetical protein [Calothrix sp. MO_192.B10]
MSEAEMLKRTEALAQSDSSDFVFKKREFIPRRTFGLVENAASYEFSLS